jgi:NADH:ubiquinone oxidoreductase subunit 3 (subunit A)
MRIPTLKHFFFYQLVYPFALFLVKASILALYYRIFAQVTFRYYIHLVAGFVTVYTVVVLFVVVSFPHRSRNKTKHQQTFECRPKISQAWAPSFPKGCNSLRATYIAVAAINIVTDITIFLMPLRAFWRLEIAQRKRCTSLLVPFDHTTNLTDTFQGRF